ncbi:hypothetical protein DFH11DRAFT_210965 [Phellopilus nigrolimitatus]|nr:hypothetical protein DFH11DRAFT_210965 [Phellopilus nigrolimitatus]
MPLDGHSYLVAQGWSGKGSGLRNGAISRPLAIPQKRTLAGLGKDRDEAFPFWDHVFSVAAKTIQVKIHKDDDDSSGSDADSAPPLPTLTRTSTGLLSNKRPVVGTPASSGGSTPCADSSNVPRMSLIAAAKRAAARKGLYARFFRGPVLGPDIPDEDKKVPSTSPSMAAARDAAPPICDTVTVGSINGSMSKEQQQQNEKRTDKRKRKSEKEKGEKCRKTSDEKKGKREEKEERKRAKRKGKEREVEIIRSHSPVEPTDKTMIEKERKRKRSKDENADGKKKFKKQNLDTNGDTEDELGASSGVAEICEVVKEEEVKLKKKKRRKQDGDARESVDLVRKTKSTSRRKEKEERRRVREERKANRCRKESEAEAASL